MDACAEGIWEGPQNGGSTGTLGAMQEVWITVYQHLPVAEYGEVRITWDMAIFMDKQLKHNCPDSTVVHKDIVTGVNTY